MRTTETGGDRTCIDIETLRGHDGRDGPPGIDGKDGEQGDQGGEGNRGTLGPRGLQGPPAPLPRAEWSTHAGGGPRVRVDREQSWSTAEGLEGVTTPTKEELSTTSSCQTILSTPAMHLECRTAVTSTVLCIKQTL